MTSFRNGKSFSNGRNLSNGRNFSDGRNFDNNSNSKSSNRLGRAFGHGFLLLVCVFTLYVFFLMVSGSLKTSSELVRNVAGFPKAPTLDNFVRLFGYNSGVIIRSYFNGLFIAVSYTLLTLMVASLGAFAFSKYSFKGKNLLFVLLLITMMVPPELNMTPLYILFSKIGWLNTYQVQIIPGIANVFALFLLRQHMNTVPDSLLEAARIDGSGHFRIFLQIMVPVSVPAISSLSILVFLSKWNDYMFPSLMIKDIKYLPMMVVLPTLNVADSAHAIPWELVLTGCVIVTLPLIVLFLVFQDKFMSSVTLGAVKG